VAVWASWVKSYPYCPRDSWLKKRGRGAAPTFELLDWRLWHDAHKALKVRELQLLPDGGATEEASTRHACEAALMRYACEELTELTKSKRFSQNMKVAQEKSGKKYPLQERCIEVRVSLAKKSDLATERIKARKAKIIYQGNETYASVADVRYLLEETTKYPRGRVAYVPGQWLSLGARPDIFVAYRLRGEQKYRCFPLDIKSEVDEGAELQNRVGYEVMLHDLKWMEEMMQKPGEKIELVPAECHGFYTYNEEGGEDVMRQPVESELQKVYDIASKINKWNGDYHPLRKDCYSERKCSKCSSNEVCAEKL
jgi:hypothetical protein